MAPTPGLYDLIVMGGGPGGASAAIGAAACGARVLLLEQGLIPRHKVCGEFVSAESLGVLSSLLDPGLQAMVERAVRIARARIFLDGRSLQVPLDPPAASIARYDLDRALWNSALRLGVDARSPVAVKGFAPGNDRNGIFRVRTTAGDFETRSLINAGGRWSLLNADRPDKTGAGRKWLAVKGHFSAPAGERSVDLYFFAGGYCGVAPLEPEEDPSHRQRINACAMVRGDVARSLPEVFRQHSGLEERSRRWSTLSDPVSTAPLRFGRPRPVIDGVLRVGDAAAFVDPFVGDGISLALRSGRLAAESLTPFLTGRCSHQQAAQAYQQAYVQRFGSVFTASAKIRAALRLPKAFRSPLLFLLERSPSARRYLVQKTR